VICIAVDAGCSKAIAERLDPELGLPVVFSQRRPNVQRDFRVFGE